MPLKRVLNDEYDSICVTAFKKQREIRQDDQNARITRYKKKVITHGFHHEFEFATKIIRMFIHMYIIHMCLCVSI